MMILVSRFHVKLMCLITILLIARIFVIYLLNINIRIQKESKIMLFRENYLTYLCLLYIAVLNKLVLNERLVQKCLSIFSKRLSVTSPCISKRRYTLGFIWLQNFLICSQLKKIFIRIGILNDFSIWRKSSLICCFFLPMMNTKLIKWISFLHFLVRYVDTAFEKITWIASNIVVARISAIGNSSICL